MTTLLQPWANLAAPALLKRRRVRKPLARLGAWLAFLVLGTMAATGAPSQPNFIFILIDDMGYGDLSCYGGEGVQTTHIDRLAHEGIRFTQFYVASPICSPSRTAFTTGQYPARWRITSYLAARRENERRGMAQWLDPKAPTLARMLREAGYTTGHFGKWHMGGQRDVGEAPLITEYGFDESLTQFEGLGDRILPLCDAFDGSPPTRHALGSDNLGRGNITWMDRSKITGAFVERALKFIQRAEQTGRPFYVNLWPDDVHSPFFPPKDLRGDGSKRQLYLGVVKAMDEQFAPLFDYVRASPTLRSNTLIIVSSDNGPEPGAGVAGPFRGHKGTLYEGGIREPLIVWGPGLVDAAAAGSTNDRTVLSAVDFVPSLARLAGAKLPENVAFDGQDLSRALTGKTQEQRSKPLLWNRPPDRAGQNGERWPDLAIREADWKLLQMEDGSQTQLYNLAEDPGETRNLAEAQPAVVQRLRGQLMDWRKTLPISAPIPPGAANRAVPPRSFVNPIAEGADPWIVRHQGTYISCQSEGNRAIALYFSEQLTTPGRKRIIWRAPREGMCSAEIWAPELHFLDGRWHVYFAGSDGQNRNHRMWVLQSEGADPLGPYTLHGPLYTGDHPETGTDNRWAIDGTILETGGRRYFVWSGWEDERDEQWLYLAPMKDPLTLGGRRVRLCDNDDYLWERVDENERGRGLHEAPQVLQRDGRTFIVYSCSGSWQPSYKLGLLELRANGDPLNPADWKKHPIPVFQSSPNTFGVGHNCFVKSPDGREDWLVYHAKLDRANGWRRTLFAQPFHWTPDGLPLLGAPLSAGVPLPWPAGQVPPRPVRGRWLCAFNQETDLDSFHYYGHHQFMAWADGKLHLGVKPRQPVNAYRAGEKALVAGGNWRDFSASARVCVVEGTRDAGLLFRCTLPAVGYDAQRGYFAGIIPGAGKVVLGSMNGESWREIALVEANVKAGVEHWLSVTARGEEITVRLDGREVLRRTDEEHRAGSIGLRVVDTHATFDDLEIQ